MFKKLFIIIAILFLSLNVGNAEMVTLTWTEPACTGDCVPFGIEGYMIYWAVAGVDTTWTAKDVENVLTAQVDIPDKSWIMVRAYTNEKKNVSNPNGIVYFSGETPLIDGDIEVVLEVK